MSVAAVRGQPEASKDLSTLSKIEKFRYLKNLFQVLGYRHIEEIKGRLEDLKDKEGLEIFGKVHACYYELQKRFAEGVLYNPHDFPCTEEVIKSYCPATVNREFFLADLKLGSYEALPSPQKGSCYPNPDLEILKKIENAREEAFRHLMAALYSQESNPILPIVQAVCSITRLPSIAIESFLLELLKEPKPVLSEEQQMNLSSLYYNRTVLTVNKKPVFFSELIDEWILATGKDPSVKNDLLTKIKFQEWVKEKKISKIDSKINDVSFKEYLIRKSIQYVSNELRLEISADGVKKLRDLFQNEAVRLSVCSHKLDEMNLENFERKAENTLFRIQVFNSLDNKLHLEQNERTFLFEMLLLTQRLEIPEGFQTGKPDEEFQAGWDSFKSLFEFAKKDEKSVYWPFLCHLWKAPDGDSFVKFFMMALVSWRLPLGMSSLYSFCKENEVFPSNLQEIYKAIVEIFQVRNLSIIHPEKLFFEPAEKYDLLEKEKVIKNTKLFLDHIDIKIFQNEGEYLFLLRRFIIKPSPSIFDFLKDAENFGLKIRNSSFLYKIFTEIHAPVSLDLKKRDMAKGFVLRIKEKYQFSDENLFFLYLEFIRVIDQEKENEIRIISQFVDELEHFCPSVSKENIYFLYLYRPKIISDHLRSMSILQKEWIENEDQRSRTIIDPSICYNIIENIQKFVSSLSKNFKEEEAQIFQRSCVQELLSAFFPPLQPLTDYFKIDGVFENKISWLEAEAGTHLGQVKFILGNASLGIYLHWSLFHRKPTLSLSFFNTKTHEAHSAVIPLAIPENLIKEDAKRKSFFGLLYALGQILLGEEVHLTGPYKEDLTSYDVMGVKELLDERDQRESKAILNFLSEVKGAYRNEFLRAVTGAKHKINSSDPKKIAASGHIFPFDERGALLPKAYLDVDPDYRCYVPDQRPFEIKSDKFQIPKNEWRSLGINMQIKRDQGVFVLPATFKVLDEDTVCEKSVSAIPENRRGQTAPQRSQRTGLFVVWSLDAIQVPLRYPPEVLEDPIKFQTYVDFHNLMLKSRYYYSLERRSL